MIRWFWQYITRNVFSGEESYIQSGDSYDTPQEAEASLRAWLREDSDAPPEDGLVIGAWLVGHPDEED